MNENMRYLKEEQQFFEKARAEGISPARALKGIVEQMLDDEEGEKIRCDLSPF